MPVGFSPRNPTLLCLTGNLNPKTTNRRDYTEGLATANLPDNANSKWLHLTTKLRDLYTKLATDPAMKPNLEQTFSTPANSQNKVYFCWDFAGRTLHKLYLVPCTLKDITETEEHIWQDVQGRAVTVANFITDPSAGLEFMTEMAYPDQRNRHPKFSEEVMEAAKEMLKRKEGKKGKKNNNKMNGGGGVVVSQD